MSVIVVRRATLEDQAAVEAIAKASLPVIRDFKFIWRRDKSWEPSPPFVATINGEIVGFHAVKFLQKTYVNAYYLCTAEEHKKKGVAKAIMQEVLKEAAARGLTRYTSKAATDGQGYSYYTSLGLVPFCISARKPKGAIEYMFDFSIEGITTIDQLKVAAASGSINTAPDPKRLGQYAKKYEYTYTP